MNDQNPVLNILNDYTFRVNRDMTEHVRSQEPVGERIRVLLSHTVSAHQVWLERMDGKSMSVKIFEVRPYEELLLQNERNHARTAQILKERDVTESIEYVNTKRQRFRNSISEMFIHLFNHSTYHRGQINQLLVQEGKQPMVSDFIVYNRTEII